MGNAAKFTNQPDVIKILEPESKKCYANMSALVVVLFSEAELQQKQAQNRKKNAINLVI